MKYRPRSVLFWLLLWSSFGLPVLFVLNPGLGLILLLAYLFVLPLAYYRLERAPARSAPQPAPRPRVVLPFPPPVNVSVNQPVGPSKLHGRN